MIGFCPQPAQRVAIRNDQGQKVAYLASINNRQVLQSVSGKPLAYILRWKQSPSSRTGACGASFAPIGENYRA